MLQPWVQTCWAGRGRRRHTAARLPPPPFTAHCLHARCRRLGSVSLVSKRFHDLCLAPQLVREVSVDFSYSGTADARLHSLRAWLVNNAPPIVNFSVDCHFNNPWRALLMPCLTALCAAAPLQQLAVRCFSSRLELPLSVAGWLQPVHATLRLVDLKTFGGSDAQVIISIPLQQFTALRKLTVYCNSIEFSAGCWLPVSLTYLSLCGLKDQGLPSQVSVQVELSNQLSRNPNFGTDKASAHWCGCRS